MKKKIYQMICFVIFSAFVHNAAGQRPPREIRDFRDRERKTEEKRVSVEKADNWKRGQRKDSFKDAVDGRVVERKMVEREPPSRGGRKVEKADKWSRGNNTKKFNDSTKPDKNNGDKTDNGGKDDGKKSGEGNPQPAPKPNLPSPAKRGF